MLTHELRLKQYQLRVDAVPSWGLFGWNLPPEVRPLVLQGSLPECPCIQLLRPRSFEQSLQHALARKYPNVRPLRAPVSQIIPCP